MPVPNLQNPYGLPDNTVELVRQLPPLIEPKQDYPPDEPVHAIPRHNALPPSFSLAGYAHPILQQYVGACAPYSVVQMIHIHMQRLLGTQGKPILLSPLDLYFHTRAREGNLGRDSGTTLPGVLATLRDQGGIPFNLFPEERLHKKRPPEVAVRMRIRDFERIDRDADAPDNIKKILFYEKLPVLVGFRIPREQVDNRFILGSGDFEPVSNPDMNNYYAHAMVIVGWRSDQRFILLNSWGAQVGAGGYFTCPIDWVRTPWLSLGNHTFSVDLF